MGQNDGVRLQLSQVEVKPTSGRETPDTSFASTLQNGMVTTANVVGSTAQSAGYMMVPGAAVLGAAVTSAGVVRGAQGSNGTINGGGMTGMGAYGGMSTGMGMGMGGSGILNASSGMNMTGGMGGMGGAGGAMGMGGGGYMDNMANRAAGGDASAQMMMATQQMQEMNQAFNLQYLQLQEKMQQEGREFTCLSNVMKAKNDTAKNSLSNLK
jgi:hypothetical protein